MRILCKYPKMILNMLKLVGLVVEEHYVRPILIAGPSSQVVRACVSRNEIKTQVTFHKKKRWRSWYVRFK